MDLDELKTLWAANDPAFAAGLRVERAEALSAKAERRIWFELALDAIAILLIGSYVADTIREPKFAVPAILLGLYAIGFAIARSRQLVALNTLDYGEPVLEIAKALRSMRARRATAVRWIALTAPLLWVPLQIVGFRAFFGIDAYATFGIPYLAANAIFGLACIPVGLWLAERFGARLGETSLARAFADDLTGRAFTDAIASLERARAYAREG